MNNLFIIITVITSTFANAAFLFDFRKKELLHDYSLYQWLVTSQFKSIEKLRETGAQWGVEVEWLPATVWNLFLFRANFLNDLGFKAIDPIKNTAEALERSKQFKKYLFDKQLLSYFEDQSYSQIVDALLDDLTNFHFKDDFSEYSDFCKLFVLNSSSGLVVMRKLLLHSIELEIRAEQANEVLFVRFTRFSSKSVNGEELNLWDAGVDEVVRGKKFVARSISFGSSILAAIQRDGRIPSLFDMKTCSACVFSYYLSDLRDRLFVKGLLPFEPRQFFEKETPDLGHSGVYAIRFPRATVLEASSLSRADRFKMNWHFGEFGNANGEIMMGGEEFHPRLKTNFKSTNSFPLEAVIKNELSSDKSYSLHTFEILKDTVNTVIEAEWLSFDGLPVTESSDFLNKALLDQKKLLEFLAAATDDDSKIDLMTQLVVDDQQASLKEAMDEFDNLKPFFSQ